MSADRRFKVTFLATVLAALVGFGTWYGFVRDDGEAGRTAQDKVAEDVTGQDTVVPGELLQEGAAPGEIEQDDIVREAARPEAGASDQTMAEASAPAAGPLSAAEPATVEQLPDAAEPADAVAAEGEAGVEVAAVDASVAEDAVADISVIAPPPVFDIVRVEPSGDAVIAGRSQPGAVVELVRNGVVHDRIAADASGSFAFIPPPFPAGTSEVVLRTVAADGGVRQSEQSVTVVIADDRLTTPMVALVAPDRPTVVLSRPEDPMVEVAAVEAGAEEIATEQVAAEEAAPSDRQQIAAADASAHPNGGAAIRIASVEAESGGGLYVTGEAAPNAAVRLYLNDTFVAPADAGADGTVSFAIARGVRPGSYRVRLDQVAGETGSVLSRAEIVFVVPELPALVAEAPVILPDATASPEPAEQVETEERMVAEVAPERAATAIIPEISTAVVTRGDSLWRISREVYGSGMRYTEIFEANQNQIRNPDLIYPGQLFVLPADPRRVGAEEAGQSVN